ncbi:MAG: EcsC family protein [Verrucomicrobiales bacterium]
MTSWTLDDAADQADLERAFCLLEKSSFADKTTRALGTPVSKALALLPADWSGRVNRATEVALEKALTFVVRTLKDEPHAAASRAAHKLLSGLTGALGGAFGLPALAIELPLSLMIMLRSIADIARSEGESTRESAAKLACLEVLALGGIGDAQDAAKSGYYAVRMAMAAAVSEAIRYVAEKGIVEEGAPALVRLLTKIASRLSLQVTEKSAAQAIPIIGAVGGAAINLLFIDHFQDLARGHFTVRRLERKYGVDKVRDSYENCGTKLATELEG